MTQRYRITLQNGDIVDFEGPDGLSKADIESLATTTLRNARPGMKFVHPVYVPPKKTPTPVPQEDKVSTATLSDLVAGREKPAYGENESSAGGSYLRGGLSGMYMNWEDELASGGNALIPGMAWLDNATGAFEDQQGAPLNLETLGDIGKGAYNVSPLALLFGQAPMSKGYWDRYEHNMDVAQHQREADIALHPTARFTGQVSGALATLPVAEANLARVPQGIRLAAASRPILTGAVLGGTTGAISGAGDSRGNRAQGAALGATVGAPLGGAISGAIVSAPIVGQYAQAFLGRGKAVTSAAIQQITKALQRDGYDVTSPAGVQKLKGALEEYSGKPVSLADIGAATRSRAGVGMRSPSAQQQTAADTVLSRQAGQPQRIARDIRETVAPRTDVHAIDEDLVAQRAAEAERLRDLALYEQVPDPAAALEDGVERTVAREVAPTAESSVPVGGRQSRIVEDPELQQLARLPFAQPALKGAVAQATAERDLLAATGRSIDHIPDLTPGSNLDMRAFDYLKRYLDDEVNTLYKRGQGRSYAVGEAKQVEALRNAIRERLRSINPEYANYLDTYKGSSEMIDALRSGREFSALDPEQIASEQAGRSTAGQELYRVGAARDLLDRIKGTRGETAVPANRILNSPEEKEQLLATGVIPENFNLLNLKLGQERNLSLLPKELQGAQTAQRLAAQADAEGSAPIVPFNPASGYGWAGALIRAISNRATLKSNAAINEELLPRLLSQDPKVINATIAELERAGQKSLANQIRRSLKARRASAVGGNIIGSPVALPAEDY